MHRRLTGVAVWSPLATLPMNKDFRIVSRSLHTDKHAKDASTCIVFLQQKWRAVLNILGNVDYNIIMGGISGPKHTHIIKYTQLSLALSPLHR